MPVLPKVLLIGDSISMGYAPLVAEIHVPLYNAATAEIVSAADIPIDGLYGAVLAAEAGAAASARKCIGEDGVHMTPAGNAVLASAAAAAIRRHVGNLT